MKLVRAVRWIPVVAALAALVLVVGCSDVTAPSNLAAYSQTDLTIGDGDEAVAGKSVSVNYTGWLYDRSQTDNKGLQFDTSTGRGPLIFTLGTGAVIAGWDKAIPGMKVNGVRRLVIPPSLGYGPQRYGPIPPNSSLVFDIQLLSVQ